MNSKSKREIIKQQTRAKFPYLIEITMPDNEIVRYNNTDEDITYEGNVYKAGFFYLTPPKENNGVISDTTITISAIDQYWIKKIRNASPFSKSTIRYVAVIMYDEDGTSYIDPCEDNTFFLSKANWDDFSITWSMTLDDVMTVQIPCDTASPLNTTGAY